MDLAGIIEVAAIWPYWILESLKGKKHKRGKVSAPVMVRLLMFSVVRYQSQVEKYQYSISTAPIPVQSPSQWPSSVSILQH